MTDLKIVANYIREHGWTQGCLREFDGRVCLVGAIDRVGVDFGNTFKEVITRIFKKYPDYDIHSVATWNDMPGRTVDEVLALLESD